MQNTLEKPSFLQRFHKKKVELTTEQRVVLNEYFEAQEAWERARQRFENADPGNSDNIDIAIFEMNFAEKRRKRASEEVVSVNIPEELIIKEQRIRGLD